jgi:hypothetical protein
MAVVSLLVPVVLWKRGLRNLLPVIIVPFVLVAVPLCAYNYARFGSIFDFGANYNLTSFNMTAYGLLNPLAKAIRRLVAPVKYLFTPVAYKLTFPFVGHLPRTSWTVHGSFQYSDSGVGIICFPIVFCLLWLIARGEKPRTIPLMAALLVSACAVILLNSWFVGFVGRYSMDFAVFVILPSLFCAYYWCSGHKGGVGGGGVGLLPAKGRLKAAYILLAVSIFTGMFLFVSGLSVHPHSDPVLYRYLETSLGFIRDV